MRNRRMIGVAFTAMLLAISALEAHAQAPTGIPLFGPVNVTADTASAANPLTFATKTLNLSCPDGPTAVVSSTADGSGKIIVDNYIYLTITQGGSASSDICSLDEGADFSASGPANGQTSCFRSAYEGFGGNPAQLGKDPDTFDLTTYGVGPLDFSSQIVPGSVQLQFDLIDWGTPFASTTLYLYTNCAGATVSSETPTTTDFNTTAGQQVTEVANFTASTVFIQPGTNLIPSAAGVAPGDWPQYVAGSPFATTQCIPHAGQNGKCTLYTDLCTNSNSGGSTPAGTNCPQATQPDIVIQDVFDAASKPTSLPPGYGFGFLMGSDNWSTQGQASCILEGNPAGNSCPQNILVDFSGDGSTSTGKTKSLNSTLVSVYNVLMPTTFPSVSPVAANGWTNSVTPPMLSFASYPPGTSDGHGQGVTVPTEPTNPSQPLNGYVAAPVHSIAYTVNGLAVPSSPIVNTGDCFVLGSSPVQLSAATPFTPLAVPVTLIPGPNTIQYSATDCAGISELLFNFSGGSWSTTPTKLAKVYFDNTGPAITCPPSDTAWHNANVSVSCTANDDASGFLPATTDSSNPSYTVISGPTSIGTLSETIAPSLSTNVGVGQEVPNAPTGTASAVDLAGNSSSLLGPTFNIDRKAPSISAVSPALSSTQNYYFNQVVNATYKCSDGGSGVAKCGAKSFSPAVPSTNNIATTINTAVLGQGQHYSVTANDAVLNSATSNLFTYNVSYLFIGFLTLQQPPLTNPLKAGKATAILFDVQDGKIRAVSGLKLAPLGTVTVAETVFSGSSCSGAVSSTPAFNGSLNGLPLGAYSLKWTPPTSLAGHCVSLGVNLGDGVTHKVNLRF